MDFLELELSADNALNKRLLTSPKSMVYGGEAAANELKDRRIRVRLAERPTARNLRTLLEAGGKPLPADISLYAGYRIWLLSLTVGIVREGGWRDVTQLGLQVELPESPRFTVLSLVPETRFVTHLDGKLECHVNVEANGSVKVPDLPLPTSGLPVSAGASADMKLGAGVGLDLSVSVLTPVVIATGKGDRRAEWVLEPEREPLVGDQELLLTMLAPLNVDEVLLKARLRVTISTFDFLPFLLQTGEIALTVPLS
jgi:hypothetical protein